MKILAFFLKTTTTELDLRLCLDISARVCTDVHIEFIFGDLMYSSREELPFLQSQVKASQRSGLDAGREK